MSENTAPKVLSAAGKPVMLKRSSITEKDGLFICPLPTELSAAAMQTRAEANMNYIGANNKAHCC